MTDLRGRRILVTGAHRGAGAAAAVAAAGAGAAVICADRRLSGETVATIRAAGGRAETWQCDVADDHSVAALFDALGETGLPLDGVIHAAAIGHSGEAGLTSPESFDRVMGTNLRGSFLVLRAAAAMMAGPGGRIVVAVTDPAGLGGTGTAIHAASLAAMQALAAGWGRELPAQTALNIVSAWPGTDPEETARLALALLGPGAGGLRGQVLRAGGPAG